MEIKRIDLYEYFGLERENGAKGFLTVYAHNQSKEFCTGRLRPAMLVFPGGGYEMLSDRENECIATVYFAKGYNAFVLEYSLVPHKYPTQLIESCMAMAYIRENAVLYNIDAEHVASIGFSAGGHVCGMLAVGWNRKEVFAALGERAKLCRPDAIVLSYAVVTSELNVRQASINNVSGNDEEIAKLNSVEKFVTADTPPAFIWATADDDVVNYMNSILVAKAYGERKVPFELHIFESGSHGLSLATRETANCEGSPLINDPVSQWFGMALTWLKNRGFEIKF